MSHNAKPFNVGERVQLHAATDEWMQGDRYGTVVGYGRMREFYDTDTKERGIVKPVRVRLDKSRKTKRFHPDNLHSTGEFDSDVTDNPTDEDRRRAATRRINLRQQAANRFTNVTDKDVRREMKRGVHWVSVHEERDNLQIVLYHGARNDPDASVEIATWTDDDARQMFEDGFFRRGRQLEPSVIEYAQEMGLGQ